MRQCRQCRQRKLSLSQCRQRRRRRCRRRRRRRQDTACMTAYFANANVTHVRRPCAHVALWLWSLGRLLVGR